MGSVDLLAIAIFGFMTAFLFALADWGLELVNDGATGELARVQPDGRCSRQALFGCGFRNGGSVLAAELGR
jgi:hypothetical protein